MSNSHPRFCSSVQRVIAQDCPADVLRFERGDHLSLAGFISRKEQVNVPERRLATKHWINGRTMRRRQDTFMLRDSLPELRDCVDEIRERLWQKQRVALDMALYPALFRQCIFRSRRMQSRCKQRNQEKSSNRY